MEIFEFWKTMNKQTKQFHDFGRRGLGVGGDCGGGTGPGAEKGSHRPDTTGGTAFR